MIVLNSHTGSVISRALVIDLTLTRSDLIFFIEIFFLGISILRPSENGFPLE